MVLDVLGFIEETLNSQKSLYTKHITGFDPKTTDIVKKEDQKISMELSFDKIKENERIDLTIEASPADTCIKFSTNSVPTNWDKRIGQFNPEISVEGSLGNLSSESSKNVMSSLVGLPNSFNNIERLSVYDNNSGITAMWQNSGWGDRYRHFIATKTPIDKLHTYIDKLAQRCKVDDYQILGQKLDCRKRNVNLGVEVKTEDADLLKLFNEFTKDKKAEIKDFQYAGGMTNSGHRMDYSTAKNLIFPTDLKELSGAKVNCYVYGRRGLMSPNVTDKSKPAIYVNNDVLEIITKTPQQMLETSRKLLS